MFHQGKTGVCHAPTHTGQMDFRSILCATAKHCSACIIRRKSCSENSIRHFRGGSSPVRVWIFRVIHLAVPEGYGQEDRPSLPAASKHSRMLHTRSRVPNGETAKTGVRHDTTDAHRPLKQSVLPGYQLENLLTLPLPIAFRSDLQALFNFALFWDASRK